MRVLREVAARGSFSAAADALAYTQSAVSQQIAALEREAGTTLVERNARGVRLTDAGRALVEHADAILARLSDAEAELEAIAGLRGGRLRLAAFPSAGASIMPEAIARFRERHPAVELTLEPAEPGPALSRLRGGEVDIALDITVSFRALAEDGIERLHLLDDPMYVALPKSHPLARKRGLKLEELADENWILGTTGSCPDASIFLRSCQVAGFEPRIAFNSDDYFAMQGFVAAGVGRIVHPRPRADVGARGHRRAVAGPDAARAPDHGRHAEGLLPVAGQAGDARRPRRGRRGVRRQASRPRAGLVASFVSDRQDWACWPGMADNADIVRRAFEAFSRRDLSALLAIADPDIEFMPATARVAGRGEPYRGHEGLRTYFADVARVWQELRSEPAEFIEVEDVVVCTGRVYAWGVGRVIDAPAGWVWRLRDGKLVEGRVYENQREALAAAGLA